MKITKKQFDAFRKECFKLRKLWGLQDWNLHVVWDDNDKNAWAQIYIDNLPNRTVTIYFPKTINQGVAPGFKPKLLAKHEMLHLLTGRMYKVADQRYGHPDDLSEEWEALVNKLGEMI